MLYKYQLQLNIMHHRSITFLGILPCNFYDRVNVLLPCLHTIFQSITFGIIIPDKTANITRACAQFKSMTKSKPFPDFKFSGRTIKTLLEGLGQYPHPRLNRFRKLKYNLEFTNVPKTLASLSYQGQTMPVNYPFSHLISKRIPTTQTDLASGPLCVTISLLCIKLAVTLLFHKIINDQ